MLEATNSGVRLRLYVQPNGKKSEILGEHDGALKIRIQAAPVDGKANAAVEQFVAQLFDIARGRVAITKGQQSRTKFVEVSGLDLRTAERYILRALADMKAK